MLTGQKGVFDAKNPYPAPIAQTRELFQAGERNCIFAEFDIEGSGLRYQAGDHVGVWPVNPDHEVERTLRVLGLEKKAETVIEITSLDPALAKVPFPTPTTYDAIFRHYVDVCAVASRQAVGALAAFAPNDKAKQRLEKIGADKDFYSHEVADKCHTVAQVLLEAAGDDPDATASELKCTAWQIPFDRIVSIFPRLQPRYYSISSSPKISPTKVAITAVVLKYEPNVKNRPDHGQGEKSDPKCVRAVPRLRLTPQARLWRCHQPPVESQERVSLAVSCALTPLSQPARRRWPHRGGPEVSRHAQVQARRSARQVPQGERLLDPDPHPSLQLPPADVAQDSGGHDRARYRRRALPRLCPGACRPRSQGQGAGWP